MRNVLISLLALIIGMGSAVAKNREEDELLKRFKAALRKEEGLRLEAYKPDARESNFTIGYGHYSPEVKSGQRISKERAEELLDKDVKSRLNDIRASIKNYDSYPESAKEALFSSWYRGSLAGSPKTIKLLNEGKYKEASAEFLDNDEYRRRVKEGNMPGVIKRMDRTSREILNINNRKPQSEDTMQFRPEEEEEEVKKKPSADELRRQFNTQAVDNTPAGQQMSEAQKRAFAKEQLNPENQMESAAKTQAKKVSGEQISAKDNFMEAITYFLPAITGLAVGGAIAGEEGAARGADLGFKAGEGYRKAKLARERFEFQKEQANRLDPAAQQRLDLSKQNLEMRKKELQAQIDRSKALAQERGDRRYERYDERANKLKDTFMNRNDIKSFREQEEGLIALEEMVTTGKKIPGGSLALISKGLSGETGVLTDRDIQRAQVNPDVWNKLKRGYYTNFKGEILPEDAKEILKIAKLKSKALKERIRSKVGNFAKSRSKTLSPEHGEILGLDLNLELGLEDFNDKVKEKKPLSVSERMESWDEEKKKRYREWKARRNK